MFEVRYKLQSHGAIQFKQYNFKNLGGISVQVRNVCLQLRCNLCRGDLPLFVFMRHKNDDTCPCAKHSSAPVTDEARNAINELFSTYGDYSAIDRDLWQIIVAAIASKELDQVPGFERANYLGLYREVTNILKLLKPTE